MAKHSKKPVKKLSKPKKAIRGTKKSHTPRVSAFKKSMKVAVKAVPAETGKGSRGRGKKKVEDKPKASFIRSGKVVPTKATGLFITRSAITPIEAQEKSLSATEVQKFRDILVAKRDDLVQLIARKKETEFQEVEPEIGDEADIATASVEKDVLFELADVEQQTLDSVEASLRKIEKGFYGKCEVCMKQIPRKRLEVMPWARNDIYCQVQNEQPAPPPAPEAA